VLRLHGTRAGRRVDAAVGKRGRHHREFAGGGGHRALARVQPQRAFDVVADHLEVAQQVRYRAVAVTRTESFLHHRRMQLRLPPEVGTEHLHGPVRSRIRIGVVQQRRHRDRAGIDHRVVRQVVFLQLDDRVEGFARRLHAHLAVDFGAPEAVEGQPVDEGLGHRLQREAVRVVAGLRRLAVHRHRRDGEGVRVRRVDIGQERGDLAPAFAAEAGDQVGEQGGGIVGKVALHDRRT